MTMIKPVAKLTPGATVVLGGHAYVLPPIPFAGLKRYAKQLAEYDGRVLDNDDSIALAEVQISLVLAALQRNYPEASQEWLENVIGIEQVQELYAVAMNASGITAQGQEQGGEPLGEPTGIASSPTS